MAFGFPPNFIQEIELGDLNKDHALALAAEAATELGWQISNASESGFVAHASHSLSSWGEEITFSIDDGLALCKSESVMFTLLDWGKNKKNVEAFLDKFNHVGAVLDSDMIAQKLSELRDRSMQIQEFQGANGIGQRVHLTHFLSVFKPTKGYFVSPILININILVFVLMAVSGVHVFLPEGQDLLNWGANFRPQTLDGQWWRLFTACFLHIGILHLILNMYALLFIGILLEPILGTTRFLAAYVLSGLAASVASLWWHDLTISAGASGAIFGMYGVFFALLSTKWLNHLVPRAQFTSIAVFVGYNLVFGLRPNSGIDNAAHIGGFASGLIIGFAFFPSLKRHESMAYKLTSIGATIALLCLISIPVIQSLPNDIGRYEREMKRFAAMESNALAVFSLPEGTPNQEILFELKDRGLYNWRESIKLLKSFSSLDLPQPIEERNQKLIEYCELRIKSYELIYKAVEEDTDIYQFEIQAYNSKIEGIITDLSGK